MRQLGCSYRIGGFVAGDKVCDGRGLTKGQRKFRQNMKVSPITKYVLI